MCWLVDEASILCLLKLLPSVPFKGMASGSLQHCCGFCLFCFRPECVVFANKAAFRVLVVSLQPKTQPSCPNLLAAWWAQPLATSSTATLI